MVTKVGNKIMCPMTFDPDVIMGIEELRDRIPRSLSVNQILKDYVQTNSSKLEDI